MSGPLAGVRVLENANFISGPYASMLLADLGAEVVKIELPGTGDPFRRWSGRDQQMLPQFTAFNRGKRSLSLNLKQEGGRQAYLRIARSVDVIIENFRPGTLDGFGLGYEVLRRDNPRLVYCSVAGMGSGGPRRDQPTYDAIAQAVSGIWSQFTDIADPRAVGLALSDQITGVFAAYGILAALTKRGTTGEGQLVELSMLSASLAMMTHPIAEYCQNGEISGPTSRPHRSQTYAFVGSDGKSFGIHLSSPPKFWEGLTDAAGRLELRTDERFASLAGRVRNYEQLRAELAETFRTRPRDEWVARLAERDVPVAPIYNVAESLADPQVDYLEMIRSFGDGDRAQRLVGFPVSFAATPCEPGLPPPLLGEHNAEILGSIGYSADEIERLRADGAI